MAEQFDATRAAVRRFFAELPPGRMDSFYVPEEFLADFGAVSICIELNLCCTHYRPTNQFRFERSGWREEHLSDYQTIVFAPP